MADIHKDRTLTHPHRPTTIKGAPARRHNFHASEFRGVSLENKRNAFVRELNRFVLEYDINQSLNILPRANIKLGYITDQHTEKGVITEVQPDAGQFLDGKKFKLAHFQMDPKDSTETENSIIKRLDKDTLEDLVDAIAQNNPEVRPTPRLMTESNIRPAMSFDEEPDEKRYLATRGPQRLISKVAGRKHYRIVSKQIATPIWQLTNLSNVFHVLSGSVKVFEILAKYEWVHRDISAGNVYYHDGDGILGDLEYAKIMGPGDGHEVLTGTLNFMAAEVLDQSYLVPLDLEDDEAFVSENEPNFEHNHGHDVESVLWLTVFMLFFRDTSSPKETDKDGKDVQERKNCREYIFSNNISLSAHHRYKIIFFPAVFRKQVQWLYLSFKAFFQPLFILKNELRRAYINHERTLRKGKKKDVQIFLSVHKTAIDVFETCRKQLLDITIAGTPAFWFKPKTGNASPR